MKTLQTTYRKWSFRVVDGVLCDVLVTALIVDKRLAQRRIGRPELADYSTWVSSIEAIRLRGPMDLIRGTE
jgi:hypothetical protein